ncbi:uncharacterized protein LOC113381164, partial [Ctenocephalides felis]|uniref:uncharacterized protein LOC113381164 n=1 Tax=Ctenocephalides felis TaxID=7515 RepID=UPI000E6E36CF
MFQKPDVDNKLKINDDGVRYDTILENDVYDYSQQNDQEDELEHKCVFEVEDESELDQPEEREVNFDEQVYENAPITERKKRENTLLLGLWYGDKKPNMNYFFHVFYDDLKKFVNGIEVYIPCRRINITVKGILLLGTCDLPARSDCLNFVQYNGYYGCSYCFCPGMNFTLETGGNVHVYPYTNNIEKRTLQNCRSFADNASRDAPIMGIKGPTALSLIMPDYVMGMAIDRMHCVEGGVVKKLLSLFFNTEFKNKPFSLYAVINVIDARLKSIKPPKFVHRMPRSVTELLHWKASELKLWFFHYSLPVLYGILAPQYFEHYVLLVAGISILNSNTISLYKLDVARDFLHKVKCFEYLYGEMYCSINVHQLLHLPDCVQNLGPLWVYSCFEYEDINGQLLKLIHGTRHIDSQ